MNTDSVPDTVPEWCQPCQNPYGMCFLLSPCYWRERGGKGTLSSLSAVTQPAGNKGVIYLIPDLVILNSNKNLNMIPKKKKSSTRGTQSFKYYIKSCSLKNIRKGSILAALRTHYKATPFKTFCSWNKNRNTDQ